MLLGEPWQHEGREGDQQEMLSYSKRLGRWGRPLRRYQSRCQIVVGKGHGISVGSPARLPDAFLGGRLSG